MVHVLMISTPFNTFLDFAANQKFKVFHDSFSLKKVYSVFHIQLSLSLSYLLARKMITFIFEKVYCSSWDECTLTNLVITWAESCLYSSQKLQFKGINWVIVSIGYTWNIIFYIGYSIDNNIPLKNFSLNGSPSLLTSSTQFYTSKSMLWYLPMFFYIFRLENA